ncbi:MAG: hypothetical protein D6732_09865 [Methanobacteriota archaeon]|nr:MAG: hypothetical protein D6732_09865 [Euryarchaeota archaeon]
MSEFSILITVVRKFKRIKNILPNKFIFLFFSTLHNHKGDCGPMMEFYISLIVIGFILFLVNEFADMEVPFLVGFFFALPYCLFLWGVFGLLIGLGEPTSFLTGFLIPFVLIILMYFAFVQNKDYRDLIIGQKGRITVKTDLESTGEVVVETDWGRQFLLAKPSDKQLKPLVKGDEVIVVEFDPPFAYVEKVSESHDSSLQPRKRRIRVPTFRGMLRNLVWANKSTGQTCGICYGQISKAKLTTCPHCQTPFHKDHFESWISAKGQCPVCRNPVTINHN